MQVQLPGGLVENGQIERRARFHPLTGRIEQSLIESAMCQDRSAYVTAVLSHALDRIGELPADATTVSRLSIADRQYLRFLDPFAAQFVGDGHTKGRETGQDILQPKPASLPNEKVFWQ